MLPLGMTPDAASSPHSLATASGLLLGALGAAQLLEIDALALALGLVGAGVLILLGM